MGDVMRLVRWVWMLNLLDKAARFLLLDDLSITF